MKEHLEKQENHLKFWGVSDKNEKLTIKQNLALDFVVNYLIYCNEQDLKEIESRINNTKRFNVSIKRLYQPDYYVYEPDFIMQYIGGTKLVDEEHLSPFINSVALRQLAVLPQNRFEPMIDNYLDFIKFLQFFVQCISFTQGKEISLDSVDKNVLIKNVKKQIDTQLKTTTKGIVKYEDNFLINLLVYDCLEKKDIQIEYFDFNEFSLYYLAIDFSKQVPVIHVDDNKLASNIINKNHLNEFFDEIEKYKKKSHTPRSVFNTHNNLVEIVRKIIKQYRKDIQKHTTCSICNKNNFQRIRNSKSDTAYCEICRKLINTIFKIKKIQGKKTNRKSIIHSLTKDKEKAKKYCENLLKNVKKDDKFKNHKLHSLEKQINTVFDETLWIYKNSNK